MQVAYGQIVVGVIAVVVACKSGDKKSEPASGSPTGSASAAPTGPTLAHVPVVESPSALAAGQSALPPLIVYVDEAGKYKLDAVEQWSDIPTRDPAKHGKTAHKDAVYRTVMEAFAFGADPIETVKDFVDFTSGAPALDKASPSSAIDDPPPPEEEDKPDDGEDESGGTGTALALDEGKMGKNDSDRAEGQYRMKKVQDDPVLARERDAEALQRITGPRGRLDPDPPAGGFVEPDPAAKRLAKIAGGIEADRKIDLQQPAIVLASPRAKATALVDAIEATQGEIGVAHRGAVRPLPIVFTRARQVHASSQSVPWAEVRVGATALEIEAVAEKPESLAWTAGPLDANALRSALDTARARRKLDPRAPVDVLVASDVSVQRLVDVLVALDAAGVRMIGLGPAPDATQMKLRARRIPRVKLQPFWAQGDLDKGIIRKQVMERRDALVACYEPALAASPDLAGTVELEFTVTQAGKATKVKAAGLEPTVAGCIAKVFEKIEYPRKPKTGNVLVKMPVVASS